MSQAKTLEDLLVEKGVITKGEAQGAKTGGPAKVYWNKGTRVEFPDTGFTAGINTFIQTSYTFTDADEKVGGSNTSSFDVNTARVILQGTALHEKFEYYLSGDFAGSAATLKDAYLKWNACDWGSVKLGQFKTNVGRSWQTEDWALMFADRSIAANYFNLDRQGGVLAQTKIGDSATLGVGIFNGGPLTGEGINQTGNDTNHTISADLRADLIGKMDAYSESDVDYTDELALNGGVAYAYTQGDMAIGQGLSTPIREHNVAVDLSARVQGLSVDGEFFWQRVSPDDGEKGRPVGGYLQAGYFLEPKAWEVAARWSILSCNGGKGAGECAGLDVNNEATIGLNYYWWKHHMKAQINYSYMGIDPKEGDTSRWNKWLIQLSSYF